MYVVVLCHVFLFFKQKTAYDMRISDWSSDVCSSDLALIMDGLYGTDFSEMKKVYQDSLTLVAREGSYGVWRSSIGRAVSVVRDNLERSEAPQEEIGRASCRERVCQYV